MSAYDDIVNSLHEGQQNRWYFQRFQQDNPNLAPAVLGYLVGGPRPSEELLGENHYARQFVFAEDARRKLAPAPPPPPTGYPASYFTGPLGQKTPLPPKKGAFLVAWVGSVGEDWAGAQARIASREAAMGRKYDGLMTTYFEHDGEWGQDRLRWIHNRGCIPIMAGFHFAPLNVTQIAAGAADSTIDRYADHFKTLGFPLMIRMFHEQDLEFLSYTCRNREADFVRAWRRVVDRFKARGATNVGFWWCPMEGYHRASADASYPGDEYVDWVGTDTYNWSYVGEDSYSTPLHPGWAEFGELFDYKTDAGGAPLQNRHDRYGPRKAFVVGETGCTHDPHHPDKKAQWYRNIPAAAKQMEHLCGIAFFDQNVAPIEGPKANWLVDNPPSALAGFVEMARDPWFNTRT